MRNMRKYRVINGWPCQKVKTAMGHVMWVRMTEGEILERDVYLLMVLATPLVMILVFAWAAGMLN